jgi:hypothetical protein
MHLARFLWAKGGKASDAAAAERMTPHAQPRIPARHARGPEAGPATSHNGSGGRIAQPWTGSHAPMMKGVANPDPDAAFVLGNGSRIFFHQGAIRHGGVIELKSGKAHHNHDTRNVRSSPR